MLQKYCYAVTKKQTALSLGKKSFRGVKNSSVYAELFFWRGMKGIITVLISGEFSLCNAQGDRRIVWYRRCGAFGSVPSNQREE